MSVHVALLTEDPLRGDKPRTIFSSEHPAVIAAVIDGISLAIDEGFCLKKGLAALTGDDPGLAATPDVRPTLDHE